MRYNFTPLDVIKYTSTPVQSPTLAGSPKAKKGMSFDRIFFPFSLAILLMSLTFYGVKYMIDSTSEASVTDTTDVSAILPDEQADTSVEISPTAQMEKVLTQLGSIKVDPVKMLSTAESTYPNFSQSQLITTVNKNLLEWAALRQYFKADDAIMQKLEIDGNATVSVFADVGQDLGVLVGEYDKKDTLGKPPISQLIEEFKSNTIVK